MNREQTLQVMAILKAAYPSFYRDMTRRDAESAVALWQDMFSEEDCDLVAAAVKALIACDEKGFPPHIGAVKAKIRLLTQPQEMTDMEAWGLVQKAIRNSSYCAKEEFEKLPANVQNLVGSPAQLRDWSQMDADTVGSVVASNFQRSFRVRRQSDREVAALPAGVRDLLGGILKPVAALTEGDG